MAWSWLDYLPPPKPVPFGPPSTPMPSFTLPGFSWPPDGNITQPSLPVPPDMVQAPLQQVMPPGTNEGTPALDPPVGSLGNPAARTVETRAAKPESFNDRLMKMVKDGNFTGALNALAKGAGLGGGNAPTVARAPDAPPPQLPRVSGISGGSAGGGVEGQLGNIRSQGVQAFDKLMNKKGALSPEKKRRKLRDRYDILKMGD